MSSEQSQRDEKIGPDLSQPQADVTHAAAPQNESVMSSGQPQSDEQSGPDLSQPQADVDHASAPQKESVTSSGQPQGDEQNGPDLSQPQADVHHASTPQKESVTSSAQPQSDEQSGPDSSQPQADVNHASSPHKDLDRGTDVMGEPANPLSESGRATAMSIPTSPTSAGSFPTAQRPAAMSTPSNESGGSQQPTEQTGVSKQPPGASASPYVQTSSEPGATGKTPMDSIMQVFNKWSKKAEDMTGNVWTHLRTGPNMADTALGRISVGTKAMTGGGLEKVYRQTFDVAPDEHLLKTYACYLSTSTGPVAGTLYISTHKLAFCSDRPLTIPAPPQQAGTNNNTNPPEQRPTSSPPKDATSSPSKKSSATQQQQQQQQQRCYFKVMVPISQVESVNPSENTEKKPPEKYVQVKTTDGHDFWFMGFVNYDKGVKNLQEAMHSKATSPTTDTASNAAGPTTTTNTDSKATSPTTNTDSHVGT